MRAAAQRRLDSDDRGSSASAATGDGRHALEGAQSAVFLDPPCIAGLDEPLEASVVDRVLPR